MDGYLKHLRLALLAAMMVAGGCSGDPYRRNEEVGMVIGGIVGGVLGSEVGGGTGKHVAIVAGTLAGAAIGGSIGRSMDEVDRLRAAQTLETVRTGVSSRWRNPDTGYRYSMTPTRTWDRSGTPCREYVIDAEVGGDTQQIYGTACRQADGSWRIVD
jgi:surface antigen